MCYCIVVSWLGRRKEMMWCFRSRMLRTFRGISPWLGTVGKSLSSRRKSWYKKSFYYWWNREIRISTVKRECVAAVRKGKVGIQATFIGQWYRWDTGTSYDTWRIAKIGIGFRTLSILLAWSAAPYTSLRLQPNFELSCCTRLYEPEFCVADIHSSLQIMACSAY